MRRDLRLVARVFLVLVFATSAIAPMPPVTLASPERQDYSEDQGVKGFVYDATTGDSLFGAIVNVPATGDLTFADENGYYALPSLPPGYLDIVAQMDGYQSVSATIFVPDNATTVQQFGLLPFTAPIPEPCTCSEEQGIKGFVRDAATGESLVGALISIPEIGALTFSDENGFYGFTGVPAGNLQVLAALSGYISDSTIVFVPEGATALQVFALSRVLDTGLCRVVLTWGERPRDLDAHVWIPIAGGLSEVFFGSRGSFTSPPYAFLDVDDTRGYGPETITFAPGLSGPFMYAVHNFSGEPSLGTSGARVVLLKGTRVIQTFTTPPGDDRWWHVMNFDCDSEYVEPINSWSPSGPAPSAVDGPGTRPTVTAVPVQPVPGTPVPTGGAGLTGQVRNAATGQGIGGATVSAAGRTVSTAADGSYSIPGLPSGATQVTASASGFISDSATVVIPSSGNAVQVFALSQVLASGQTRIVLTWGEVPRDLDSHLWVPSGSSTYEVFFANRGNLNSSPFAFLDVDDTTSYGPETTTVGQVPGGRCTYAVHNYSGDGSIPTSNARVVIYRGSSVVQSFTPPGGSGRWWQVFSFDCQSGNITPINVISNDPPVTSGGSSPTTVVPPGGAGSVTGLVRNAVNGQGIAGATVSAGGRSATTTGDGSYTIDGLGAGSTQVTAAATGFISDTASVSIPAGGRATQTFALSQALAAGQMRIVLTWGATPRDLDSHLWVPSGGRMVEIYYSSRGSLTSAPFAGLDVDDRDGLGPETVTLGAVGAGRCTYAVYNYSGESSIASSGARVVVYRGSSMVQSFTVPSGSGAWWQVFNFDCQSGAITPVNVISANPPVAGGPAPGIDELAAAAEYGFTGASTGASTLGQMNAMEPSSMAAGSYREHAAGERSQTPPILEISPAEQWSSGRGDNRRELTASRL